ncbi:MAG: Type III restriction enzyme, res subunit [Microgenomates bacterium OLB23]|nr:MAG: Type III restriction enzyme, res subunit [Microgenomates bacterium OLB23]
MRECGGYILNNLTSYNIITLVSVEFRGFSPKTPEQLHNQLQAAQHLGDVQLVPPTILRNVEAYNSLLAMPSLELADRYTLRMSAYTELLRKQRAGEPATEDMQREFRRISALNNMDQYIADHYNEETESTLRGRQATVFEDIRDHLEKGKTKGYVTLPTGSGKTVLFAEMVEAMGLRTLIVVPTLPILDQTKEKI